MRGTSLTFYIRSRDKFWFIATQFLSTLAATEFDLIRTDVVEEDCSFSDLSLEFFADCNFIAGSLFSVTSKVFMNASSNLVQVDLVSFSRSTYQSNAAS